MHFLGFWNSTFLFFRQIFSSFFLIFVITNICFAQNEIITIGVTEFQNNSISDKNEIDAIKKGLPQIIITAFTRIQNLKILDRTQLEKILKEQAIDQTGFTERESLQKVGTLSGAKFLILGSFLKDFNENIRIDCRIVNTESGETIKAEEITGAFEDIFELTEELSLKLLDDLEIDFTKEEDTLKQSFNGCSYQDMLSYSLALTEIDRGNNKEAEAILKNVIADCPEFIAANELLKEIRIEVKE